MHTERHPIADTGCNNFTLFQSTIGVQVLGNSTESETKCEIALLWTEICGH